MGAKKDSLTAAYDDGIRRHLLAEKFEDGTARYSTDRNGPDGSWTLALLNN